MYPVLNNINPATGYLYINSMFVVISASIITNLSSIFISGCRLYIFNQR